MHTRTRQLWLAIVAVLFPGCPDDIVAEGGAGGTTYNPTGADTGSSGNADATSGPVTTSGADETRAETRTKPGGRHLSPPR